MAEARLYKCPRCEVEVMTWIEGKEYPEGGALSLMSRGEDDAAGSSSARLRGSGRAAGRAPSRRPAAGTRGLAAVDRRAIDRGQASIPNRPRRRGPDVRPRRVGRLGELRRAGLEKPRRRCDPPAGLLHCRSMPLTCPPPTGRLAGRGHHPTTSQVRAVPQPIRPADHFQVLTAREKETGAISGKVVHERCWPAWAEAHETE